MKETAIKCKNSGEEISSGYVVLGGDAYFTFEYEAYHYLVGALAEYLIEDADGQLRHPHQLDPQYFLDYCYDEDYLYWEDWSY
jgi:hypothetical protein